MKPIDLKFTKIEVSGADSRNDLVEVTIIFDIDGQVKGTKKQIKITDPKLDLNHYSSEILSEVREKVKNLRSAPSDDFISGLVAIKCMQDEEVLEQKLARFLMSIREKVRNGKRSSSYYVLETDLKKLKLMF